MVYIWQFENRLDKFVFSKILKAQCGNFSIFHYLKITLFITSHQIQPSNVCWPKIRYRSRSVCRTVIMELLPRGESNKRKLEEEEELVPSVSESSESEDYKLDDIRKEGQLEILQRPKRVFRDYYEEEEEEDNWSGTPVARSLPEDEYVDLPCPIVPEYPKLLRKYTTTDEGQILQCAWVVLHKERELETECMLGQEIVALCFRNNMAYCSSNYYPVPVDVDAEFLQSHLSYYQEQLPEDYGGYTDWQELAKYVNQLRKTEGFDLDKYKNLGAFADFLPKPLSVEQLHLYDGYIAKCIKGAMKLYKDAGGAELKQEKLVKANAALGSFLSTFYITFTAKSCVDGKEKHYQARVTYDDMREEVVAKAKNMVRLKK